MKKRYFKIITMICLGVMLVSAGMIHSAIPVKAAKAPAKLKIEGTNIVNGKGKKVQLKGISTHGLSWFPQYVNKKSFKYMKKKWGINTVRLAMYTAEYNGYCTSDEENRKKLVKLIDDGVRYAKEAGLPLFVSEYGLCDASGSGGVNKAEAKKWFDFIDKNKISLIAWNLSNKNETSAFIKSSCNKVSGWKNSELSESAKIIIKRYKK